MVILKVRLLSRGCLLCRFELRTTAAHLHWAVGEFHSRACRKLAASAHANFRLVHNNGDGDDGKQHEKPTRAGSAQTKFYEANLRDTDLTDADLSHADLSRADLTRADLSRADLTHAKLTDVDLTHAKLVHADLTDANLGDANLTRADLTHADLTDADLTRADLNQATVIDVDLTNATVHGGYFDDYDELVKDATVNGVDLKRARFGSGV